MLADMTEKTGFFPAGAQVVFALKVPQDLKLPGLKQVASTIICIKTKVFTVPQPFQC